MDHLAHELTLALEESFKAVEQTVKRHSRKRKGKNRRSSYNNGDDITLLAMDLPNRSEASSPSDTEGAVWSKGTQQMMTRRSLQSFGAMGVSSDSEDQCTSITTQLSALAIPTNCGSLISGADLESDSVNEISAQRKCTAHARRRRRAKLNASPAIVLATGSQEELGFSEQDRKKPRSKKSRRETVAMDTKNDLLSKRKRKSQRMETGTVVEGMSLESSVQVTNDSSAASSEAEETTDERGLDADDEQSDFYYEIGPTYGIPATRAWWDDSSVFKQMQLKNILQNTYHTVARSAVLPLLLRNKMGTLGKFGRPIRTGRRRLKSASNKSCQSSNLLGDIAQTPPTLSTSCPDKDAKRRKKLVHPMTLSDDGSKTDVLWPGAHSNSFTQQLNTTSLAIRHRLYSDPAVAVQRNGNTPFSASVQ